ncbi:MAG TPA: lytic murein transglycosylase, partial [Microlunatus sp.]|nr:lytic murein transglycosylase [Microlunatus sp.]
MKVLDPMGRKTKGAVLALSVLLVVLGGQAIRASNAPEPTDSPKATLQQASVTVPGPEKALVVQAALSSNTRGWARGHGAVPDAEPGIRPELVDAYTLALALAPTECHLSMSLLAAIGQVESGNLARQRIDAQHRVVPGVLGPVLNGSEYAAIPDTDNGRWDGHRTWDRALGPLQFLPASWRVAGMDADGDGRRDPQNVYDAAGAAMVYLCDGGRDLGTRKGLEEAVLAYNHSRDYLRLVLAWKTVFDTADVTGLGSTPPLGAWAVQSILAPEPSRTAEESTSEAPAAALGGSSKAGAVAAGARPPTLAPTGTATRTGSPATAGDPATGPTVVPTAGDPAAPSAKPDKPGDKPDKPGDKPDKPGDKPDKPADEPSDTPLPTCPTDEPTPTEDPT